MFCPNFGGKKQAVMPFKHSMHLALQSRNNCCSLFMDIQTHITHTVAQMHKQHARTDVRCPPLHPPQGSKGKTEGAVDPQGMSAGVLRYPIPKWLLLLIDVGSAFHCCVVIPFSLL